MKILEVVRRSMLSQMVVDSEIKTSMNNVLKELYLVNKEVGIEIYTTLKDSQFQASQEGLNYAPDKEGYYLASNKEEEDENIRLEFFYFADQTLLAEIYKYKNLEEFLHVIFQTIENLIDAEREDMSIRYLQFKDEFFKMGKATKSNDEIFFQKLKEIKFVTIKN